MINIFSSLCFTYHSVFISSNQNELIWVKLRQTMVINFDWNQFSGPGTCIVVNDVHCVFVISIKTSNGPNLSLEVNHVEFISIYWHPRHLYPAVSSFSVFIAKMCISSADEDAWRRYRWWMFVQGNRKRRDIAAQMFIFIECFNTWKFLMESLLSSNDNQLVFWNRIIEYKKRSILVVL